MPQNWSKTVSEDNVPIPQQEDIDFMKKESIASLIELRAVSINTIKSSMD